VNYYCDNCSLYKLFALKAFPQTIQRQESLLNVIGETDRAIAGVSCGRFGTDGISCIANCIQLTVGWREF
jgi:hypothetical protein